MRLISLIFFIGLISQFAGASPASVCGSIDFRSISNEGLERILYVSHYQRKITPVQCGLSAETLAICSSCSDSVPEEMMSVLRPILGSKSHSDWHAKWHKIRSNANRISVSLFEKLKAQDLVPPTAVKDDFLEKYGQKGLWSGENFFYMHRMMIKMVQMELASAGLPCIAPWLDLPNSVDDAIWPVPRAYNSQAEYDQDQKRLDEMRKRLSIYYDSEFLAGIALNDLGNLLEFDLHQKLHEFYRGDSPNSNEALAQGYKDDLLPVETSPNNKHFWKIHGLVDEILGAWLRANEYKQISTQCGEGPSCFEWKATWVGQYPSQ